MRTIQLYNTSKGWVACFLTNGQPEQELIDVMGTHHIPTAFTARASFEMVKTEISKLNPGYTITLS